MDQFDSSEEETDVSTDSAPLKIDWLDLSDYGCAADLGITSLPGCRFKDTWRNVKTDIATIKLAGVKDVFVLCTSGELKKYRVKNLLSEYTAVQITVHHYPVQDGMPMVLSNLMALLEEMTALLMEGHKTLIHCYGGLGRSSLVVCCLLMILDHNMDPGTAIDKLKSLRGSSAIQSIKQYNFITEFRENLKEFQKTKEESNRPVSR